MEQLLPGDPSNSDESRVVSWYLASFLIVVFRYARHEQVDVACYCFNSAQLEKSFPLSYRCPPSQPLVEFVSGVAQKWAKQRVAAEAPENDFNLAFSWDFADGESKIAATPSKHSDHELRFHLQLTPAGVRLAVHYDQNLFQVSSVQRLVASYREILVAAIQSSSLPLAMLPLMSEPAVQDLKQLLDGGAGPRPLPTILELFHSVVATSPQSIAARYEGQTLAYGALSRQADQLATELVRKKLAAGDVVAVCVRPSFDILVAILGLFKAGLVYMPLDPDHPADFIDHMLTEGQPAALILQAATAEIECFAGRSHILLAEVLAEPAAIEQTTLAQRQPDLDDPAYVFFTSGTTGKPKGILATHSNLAHYLQAARHKFGFQATDVFSSIARYTFSISLFDLLSPLAVGASVRLMPRDEIFTLTTFSQRLAELTVMHAGPSLLANLFRFLKSGQAEGQTYPHLRHISTGGDLVPASIMEEMTRVFPQAEVFVIYGCTEISCMGTTFPVERDQHIDRSFVGRPFPDVSLRLLDSHRQLVPVGVVGEIYFAGKGVVAGYLNRSDLNQDKFVELDGQRFYSTGDLGRLHENGDLEMLGRQDHQIQLRGIRIELAGIENTVRELGLAAQCAIVHKTSEDDERLVAFVVEPRDRDISHFRQSLSKVLPVDMLPQHLVVLEKMPVTANGKLDRQALQQLPWQSAAVVTAQNGPRTPQERKIAAIMARLLGLEKIGVDQSFFDLGGHSLLAVVALEECSQVLGQPIPPHLFFAQPTVAGLLGALKNQERLKSRPILLNEHGGNPQLFMLSGSQIYRPLAHALTGRLACFGVFSDIELISQKELGRTYSVEELAEQYVTMIRREQPRGPYRLLGYSFAGIVAYEVAQQLQKQGERVSHLILVDPILPEWVKGRQFRLSQLKRIFRTSPIDLFRFGWERVLKLWSAPPLAIPRFAQNAQVGEIEAKRDELNDQAAIEYFLRLPPYSGPVLLIVSEERLRQDPLKSRSCGWAPFIADLHIRGIEADHFKMMEEPQHVDWLAELIDVECPDSKR
jgi:amino acid adenylation domain-containing protein